MSKHNNVNPGHYKVAGRLKMGDPGTQDHDRQALAKANEPTPRKKAATPRPSRSTSKPQR